MKYVAFIALLFVVACEKEYFAERICLKTSAGKNENVNCSTADRPTRCWEYVKLALCTEDVWYVREFYSHTNSILCSAAPPAAQQVCRQSGWKGTPDP